MQRASRILRSAFGKFEQDCSAWGLSVRQAGVLAMIPPLIILTIGALVPFFEVFSWVVGEDSLLEWLQFLLILATGALFALLATRHWRQGQRSAALLSLAIALGSFFITGEEIAWGQRIFGWATPELLEEVNAQNETTLHNIGSLHQVSVYGVMFGGLAAAAAPLIAWTFWRQRPRSPLAYLLVPPLCLVMAFWMPFAYRFSRLVLNADERFPHLIFPITKFSEVTELCLYFGLVVFAWLNVRQTAPIPARAREAPLLDAKVGRYRL